MPATRSHDRRAALAARGRGGAGGVLLGGCASFSPDGGFATVEQAAKDRLGKDVRWARSRSRPGRASTSASPSCWPSPLTADDAVQVALLNNRGLQASFQELGIAEAELVQAGRLPNPGFSFGRMTQGDELEIERGLHFNLGAPDRDAAGQRELEARRFDADPGPGDAGRCCRWPPTRARPRSRRSPPRRRCATCAR